MQQAPSQNPPASRFIELQSVDSTNNYARELLHAGLAQHGIAVFSWEQTAGKGQRGKIWAAEAGKNIILSVIFDPSPIPLSRQFEWSAATALATRDFFSKYAGENVFLKWPNDLYWQDRKAGGILVESVVGSQESGIGSRESVVGSQWKWAIVGIGININQTSFSIDLPNPVSLKQITGKEFDVLHLAHELCELLNKRINQLYGDHSSAIISEYNACLYKRNEIVKLRKGNRVFEARIKEVTVDGKLIIQHSIEEAVDFGAIEFVLN